MPRGGGFAVAAAHVAGPARSLPFHSAAVRLACHHQPAWFRPSAWVGRRRPLTAGPQWRGEWRDARSGRPVMTIVVGYLPAKGGRASLDLAAVLARSGRAEPIAVVTVVPQHWATPSMAKVDAEFAAWAHQQGEDALDQARQYLAGKWPDVAGHLPSDARPLRPDRADPGLRGPVRRPAGARLVDGRPGRPDHRRVDGDPAAAFLRGADRDRAARLPRREGLHPGRLTCSFAATEEAADLLTATAQLSAAIGLPAADRHLRGAWPHHVPAGGRAARRGRGPAAMARTGAGRAGEGRCARLSTLGPAARQHDLRHRHRRQLGRGDGRGRLGGR